jgi:uncharacterized protein
MDHIIRRKDRMLSDAESTEILRKGEYGVLSMCSANNEGYGIPLSYALVNQSIYFHSATEGSKLDFIRNNNKVSFCVVGRTKVLPSEFGTLYESAIAFGVISEVDGEEKGEALMELVKKYSGEYIQEGIENINKNYSRVQVIKLSIESITGKAKKQ